MTGDVKGHRAVEAGERPRRVTIDLDGAWCYRRIHGHDDDPAADGNPDANDDDHDHDQDGPVDDPLLVAALPAILEACARAGTTATLFVVGRDTRGPVVARLLREAVAAGHDLQSHSYAHAYGLSRWPLPRAHADVVRSLDALAALTGARPRGFRAPGYNLSPTLVRALVDAGVQWSSSLLPSPAYFALRAAIVARTRLAGRTSASLVGDLRAFLPAPLARAPRPAATTSAGPREFPITTAAGLPWTGTTLALLPDAAAEALTTLALTGVRGADVVFELHAADFVDGALLPADQPDAAVPLVDKQRRIGAALARVAACR